MKNIADVLADPSASSWLKDALRKALDRDIVDATHDAEYLAKLLRNELLAISCGLKKAQGGEIKQ